MNGLPIRRGLCLVLAGPSGSGKTTVMQRLLNADDGLRQSVSVTTRPMQFEELVSSGGLLEHATVFGRSYGIPRAPVEDMLAAGLDVAFVVDWQGHQRLHEQLPGDVVSVFLMPPSMDELEARMLRRGDAQAEVDARMAQADGEMTHRHEFDCAITNDDLDRAVNEVADILADERRARVSAGPGRAS